MDFPTTVDNSFKLIPSISYRVKLARENKKMSQVTLAKLVGISQGTLSDLERGKNRSSIELTKIADVLGVNPIWLSEGRGEMTDARNSNVFNIKPVAQAATITNKVPLLEWDNVRDFLLLGVNFVPGDMAMTSTCMEITGGFALTVDDDKMEPEFNAGEIIIVNEDLKYKSGDYVILMEGKTKPTFKQIINDGYDWLLKPANSRYPINKLNDNQKVVGVVCGKQKRYC